ncbi:MAG: ion transporter [Spirochaetales bacterium]|nr:ion transporter [Spirochaetales bacterium]
MISIARNITAASWFNNTIVAVILAAGLVVGLETYPANMEKWGDELHLANAIILWIFIIEIVLKWVALMPRPWTFFKDPWNVFDFVIVALSLLPVGSEAVTVVRLFRLLRVLRLLRALPALQILVNSLLKSIPSMGYVGVLLGLLFYIYAVAAVFLFGSNDPWHFKDLQTAFVTLFGVVTLEGWTDIMYIQMFGCNVYPGPGGEAECLHPRAMPVGGAFFFISFVLVGTMVILNLFIGVIMNGMEEAKSEQEDARVADLGGKPDLKDDFFQLNRQLTELQERLRRIEKQALEQK